MKMLEHQDPAGSEMVHFCAFGWVNQDISFLALSFCHLRLSLLTTGTSVTYEPRAWPTVPQRRVSGQSRDCPKPSPAQMPPWFPAPLGPGAPGPHALAPHTSAPHLPTVPRMPATSLGPCFSLCLKSPASPPLRSLVCLLTISCSPWGHVGPPGHHLSAQTAPRPLVSPLCCHLLSVQQREL